MLSDRMALSAPAVSKMAREIEMVLGAPIFERKHDGVVLTDFGHSLVPHARLVLKQLERIESKQLDALCDNTQVTMRIGAPSHTTVTLLARPLVSLVLRHPALCVEVTDGIANTLFDLLLGGEIDFIVGSLPSRALTRDEAGMLHVETLHADEISIIAHPSTLRSTDAVDLGELQRHLWILPNKDSLVRNVLSNAMLGAGFPMPRPAVQTSFVPRIGTMVAEQPGMLGAVRSDTARHFAQRLGITILSLKQRLPLSSIDLIRLKDADPGPVSTEFFELIRQACSADKTRIFPA